MQSSRRPRSLKVHPGSIDRINSALYQKGYINQQVLADRLQIAPSTLSKFLQGKAVDRRYFEAICGALGIEQWQEVADFGLSEVPSNSDNPSDSSDRSDSEAISYPEGPVSPDSRFYVQRTVEERHHREIREPGALIRINAPRRMGKTSLLFRILNQAEIEGDLTVTLNLEQARQSREAFSSSDAFLHWFSASVALSLGRNFDRDTYRNLVELVGSSLGCQAYFEQHLLPEVNQIIVLGLDKVDELIDYPDICLNFFALLRIFHEESRNKPIWRKLRLILVRSKEIEVYVPLPLNQSPFNVGIPIELSEFTVQQVQDLARRHRLNWGDAEVQSLVSLVGGYPYLIRLAMYHIACQDITLPELLQSGSTRSGIYSRHLRSILAQHSDLLAAMKEVVAGNSPSLSETVRHDLYSLGLVKLTGNAAHPSCELYRQYFQNHA